MSDDKQQDRRLHDAYERVLHRMRDGADELSWERLQHELDEAVAFEVEVEEFTKDEMSLLRAWVERDLKDLRRYLAAGGSGVASWLGIDLNVLSRKISEALLSIADRSVVERERFEDDLEAARKEGLRTGYINRPTEYGVDQVKDFEATSNYDVIVDSVEDLAEALGC